MKAESFFKALIFGNLHDGNCSLESMCQILGEDYIDISKQGFHFRFKEESVKFMALMFNKSMKLFQSSMGINSKLLTQFSELKLLDSTYINFPNSMENLYRWHGSSYKDRKCNSKSGAKLYHGYKCSKQNQGLLGLQWYQSIRQEFI